MTLKKPSLWLLEAPLILFLALVVLPLIIRGFELLGLAKKDGLLLSFLLQQASFIVGTIYLKNKYPLYSEEEVSFKPNWRHFWKSLLWLPAIILLSILGTSISAEILTPILGPERLQSLLFQESSRINILFLDSWRFFVVALVICLIGPLSEEMFFRGFFFSRMSATYSPKIAYLVTSLFFALPHFYLVNFLPIFLLSLILCFLARNEGLWAAVGAHVFFNTTVFIIMFLQVSFS